MVTWYKFRFAVWRKRDLNLSTISMLLARKKQIWRLKISLCAVGYNYRMNCFEFTIHPAHATIFMDSWTYIIKEQCESACFVDFNRQCKQTTISQDLLIKIRRNFTENPVHVVFQSMKASKDILNKGVLWHNKLFQESQFLKNFKNCLLQFGNKLF